MPPNAAARLVAPASRPGAEVLDTHYHVETPEGIDLLLRPAGVVPRALAYTIDLCIRGLIMLVLMLGLAFLGKLGAGLGLLLTFIMTWWYMVLFEVLNQGLAVYCDVSLQAFDEVLPAAGAVHSAVRIAPQRMAELVDAQWVDVCQEVLQEA